MNYPRMQAQPYRRGQQQPGPVLAAMLRGAPQGFANPADLERRRRHGLALMLQEMSRGR